MSRIRIYTTPICPYCVRAKELLKHKRLSFEEIDVSQDTNLRQELVKLSGGRTSVPQIFFDDVHIGGCDDLYALEKLGDLDRMVAEMKLL